MSKTYRQIIDEATGRGKNLAPIVTVPDLCRACGSIWNRPVRELYRIGYDCDRCEVTRDKARARCR